MLVKPAMGWVKRALLGCAVAALGSCALPLYADVAPSVQDQLAISPFEVPPPAMRYVACVGFPLGITGDPDDRFGALPTLLFGRWFSSDLTPEMRMSLARTIKQQLDRNNLLLTVPEHAALRSLMASTVARLQSSEPLSVAANHQTAAFDETARIVLPALLRPGNDGFVLDHLTDWRLVAMTTWLIQLKHAQQATNPGATERARMIRTIESLGRAPLSDLIDLYRRVPPSGRPLRLEDGPITELMVTRTASYTVRVTGESATFGPSLRKYFVEQDLPSSFRPTAVSDTVRTRISNSHFLKSLAARGGADVQGTQQCRD